MSSSSHISALRQASAMKPESADCLYELGNALLMANELDESINCYKQAIALQPDFPHALNNMGVALKRQGNLEPAIEALNRAIEQRADYADAHNNLGNVLCLQAKWDNAIECFKRALSIRPDFADAHGNLGNALMARDDLDGAVACYRRSLSLRPDSPGTHTNLANVLCAKGQLGAAMAACQSALSIKPDYADAHLSQGLMLLLQGDFDRGWREYEWRWKSRDLGPPPVNFAQPRWNGQELEGRRILLHAEQGLGDTIQFVRYAGQVARRGGQVIVACPGELVSLLQGVDGIQTIVAANQELPEFDIHCPLLSLPGIFQANRGNIPAHIPYLRANSASVHMWRERFLQSGAQKIGLAWAGRPEHRQDRNRSFPLASFAPLGRTEGAMFFSLQKGIAAAQSPPAGLAITDWTRELNDFSDTAALVQNLDLIISADTAVAHLAGALGKPVWVLLPFAPDWRWMLNRTDSPWYPTMRLFRQPRPGDWTTPIAQIAKALAERRAGLPS